jgi:hypothetical protein
LSSTDDELLKAQFFFNYVEKLDAVVQKAQDGLYKKVKDTITVIVSIITLLIGFGNFILLNSYDTNLLIPIGISLILLSLSAITGGRILWYNISTYDDPLYMIQKYHEETPSYAVMITASTWADAVNKNRDFYNNKAKGYRWMLVFLGLGLAVLVITFWIQVIQLIDC